MLYKHEPNDKRIKYYDNGFIKLVSNTIFIRENGTYVWDFYGDNEYLVKPENETTEENALKEFIKIYGTDDGFYTYNF